MKLREKSVSRIASVILAAVMAVSMVPAAFAAATDELPAGCEHIHQHAVDNGDGTCSYVCDDDDTVIDTVAHVYYDGDNTCARCDHKKAATDELPAECEHIHQHAVDNGDGTCSYVCDDDGTVIDTVAHVYYDGETTCARCGHECDHSKQHAVDNGDGTCSYVCDVDGTVIDTTAHVYYKGENSCARCGHKKVATDTSWCDHMGNNWIYEDLGNGTHNVVCADCGETVSQAVPCVYTDGKCVCGAEEQTVAPVDPAEPEKPATPGTGKLDPSYGMTYRPIHQFFKALRNYFRYLFRG